MPRLSSCNKICGERGQIQNYYRDTHVSHFEIDLYLIQTNHNEEVFRSGPKCIERFCTILWPLIMEHSVCYLKLPRPVYCPQPIDVIFTSYGFQSWKMPNGLSHSQVTDCWTRKPWGESYLSNSATWLPLPLLCALHHGVFSLVLGMLEKAINWSMQFSKVGWKLQWQISTFSKKMLTIMMRSHGVIHCPCDDLTLRSVSSTDSTFILYSIWAQYPVTANMLHRRHDMHCIKSIAAISWFFPYSALSVDAQVNRIWEAPSPISHLWCSFSVEVVTNC